MRLAEEEKIAATRMDAKAWARLFGGDGGHGADAWNEREW